MAKKSTDIQDILSYVYIAKKQESIPDTIKALGIAKKIIGHSIKQLRKGGEEITSEEYFNEVFK